MELLLKRKIKNADYFIKKCVLFLLIVVFAPAAWAQEFTLVVNTTDETCPGNGTMTLSVQNATPDIPVNYKVYLLPNTTSPIWNSSNPNVPGLQDGSYLVVATQVVNGNTITDQEEVIINDQTTPLQYNITSENAVCGPTGSMTVEVSSGNPVTYEILAGPVTVAPQPSHVFNNIPAGVYQVRVIDNCGTGLVITHTVFSDTPVLAISPAAFPDLELPACDLITAGHVITSSNGVDISYPIEITYTVYPPGGGTPFIYTQTLENGSEDMQQIAQIIPFYYDTPYYYDLEITDPCGSVYNVNNNLVHQKFQTIAAFDDAGCGEKFLIVNLIKFVSPYTITFLTFPEGFDPEEMNSNHPGPFAGPAIFYGGEGIPVPFGVYEFEVLDACGRTASHQVELEDIEIEPEVATFSDCVSNLGSAQILIPGYIIETGIVTVAPEAYEPGTPHDVSGYINDDGELIIPNMATGTYLVTVIDTCGNEFEIEVIIPDATAAPLLPPNQRPDCTPGKGTVRVSSYYPPITSVVITAAPAGFPQILPYDASAYISSGVMTMDNLPPGNYTFKAADQCNDSSTASVNVLGYSTTASEFSQTLYCGSFDLAIAHTANNAFTNLWLQKLIDPDTGTWGHPETGLPYAEGSVPNEDNSMILLNNQTTYGIIHTGDLRIVKSFRSFGDGSQGADEKYCIEVLHEFEFIDDLKILGAVSLTCSGDIADVQVNALGAEPLTYELISKDGQPFSLFNGNSNVFTDLPTALYVVEVRDPCGNIETLPFNVADLPSIVSATQPAPGSAGMTKCDDNNDGVEEFDLSIFDDAILDGQDPAVALLTYHASLADAEAGINALPLNYSTGTATIYARVTHYTATTCHVVTSFDLIINPSPQLTMDDIWPVCEGESIGVIADPGYASYTWSTGAATEYIIVDEPGIYTVTVTNTYGCEITKAIEVVESELPVIGKINVTDWTDSDNVITVILDNTVPDLFEYSIDGINYQDSNTFYDLPAGSYTIYVRDKFDCGIVTEEAYLLTYPKFFTPNGDGVNDTWRIKFSILEPNMLVYIFDRYGKLITSFGANSDGWDGTLNGKRLPSTDYWFVVKRENGKELKGHFSMLR